MRMSRENVAFTTWPPGPTMTLRGEVPNVPAAGTVGTAVAFKGSATPSSCSGAPSYSWQLGDGTTSAQQNPSHTYASVGTYAWSMTASIASLARISAASWSTR